MNILDVIPSVSCGVGTWCRDMPPIIIWKITKMWIMLELPKREGLCLESSTRFLVLLYSGRSKFILQLPLIPLMVKSAAYVDILRIPNMYDTIWSILRLIMGYQP